MYMDFQKDKVQKMLGTGNEKKSLIKTFFFNHEIVEYRKSEEVSKWGLSPDFNIIHCLDFVKSGLPQLLFPTLLRSCR